MRPTSQSSSVVSFDHFMNPDIPDSELDLIFSRLGIAQQCLDIVLLFDTDGEWEVYAQGALMLLKDHKRKTYFLILSKSSGDVLWTQEIYHRCNFSPVDNFIQFSGDYCQVGLNFENEADGIRFGNKMVKRSHAKRRTKKRKSRSRSKRLNETVPEIDESTERKISLEEIDGPVETTVNHTIEHKTQTHDEVDSIKQSVPIPEAAIQQVKIEAEQQEKKKKKKRGLFRGKSKSKSKSKRKNNGRLRLEISAPSDMRRTAGLAMNPNTGRMELSCEDEKMAEILVNMGIVGSDDEAIKMLKDKRKRSRIDSAIEESGGIEKVLLATKRLTPTPEANENKGRLLISGPIAGSVTKNGRAFNYKPPVEISQKKKAKEPGIIKKVFMRQKSKSRGPPPPPKCTVPPPLSGPPPPSGPPVATASSSVAKSTSNNRVEEKPTLLRELEDSHQNLLLMIQGGPNLRHVSVSERAPPPLSPRSEVMRNLLNDPKSNLKHVPTPPPKTNAVFGDFFLSSLEKQLQEIKRMTHSDTEDDQDDEETWDEELFF